MSDYRSLTLYLDACCLNRPFDDQSQARVRLESEAVLIILGRIAAGEWTWASSEMVDLEVSRAPLDRALKLAFLGCPGQTVFIEQKQIDRARALTAAGLRAADAMHIACAESIFADVLLTTDDKMIKAAHKTHDVAVRVENPAIWLQEVI